MTIPTEVIMRMATLGLSEEQAKGVADMLTAVEAATKATADSAIEASRAKTRDRVQRWRERNVTERSETSRSGSRERVTPVEDKTLTSEIEPQDKKQNTAARGVAEFKAKLSPILDADLLNAFVAVRKTKRGALTGYAAGLFIGDAERCGMSVPDAAKECVRSSWITVKPEYFAGRPRAGPQLAAPSQSDVFAAIARKSSHENQSGPPEDRGSVRQAIPHLSAVRTG